MVRSGEVLLFTPRAAGGWAARGGCSCMCSFTAGHIDALSGEQRVIEESDDARLVLSGDGLQRAGVTALRDFPQLLWLMGVGVVDAVKALVVESVQGTDEEDRVGCDSGDQVPEIRRWRTVGHHIERAGLHDPRGDPLLEGPQARDVQVLTERSPPRALGDDRP